MYGEKPVLGSYKIIRPLGEGTFGKVFLGVHSILGRETALKVFKKDRIKPEEMEEFFQRFFREARILASLNSDYIVQVYDLFFTPQGPCIAMEYVDGSSLDKLEFNKISDSERLAYFLCILKGLDAAHQRGVVHRDLKPGNLLLESQTKKIKITDFGISLLVKSDSEENMKKVMGTWSYMSPEQASCKKQDYRSDIWSLGVILYKLYTGKLPFAGKNKLEIKKAVCQGKYRPPSQVTNVPGWVDKVVDGCLKVNPVNRYKNCKEIIKSLPIKGGYREKTTFSNSQILLGQLVQILLENGEAMEKKVLLGNAAGELGYKRLSKNLQQELEEAILEGIKKKLLLEDQEGKLRIKKE